MLIAVVRAETNDTSAVPHRREIAARHTAVAA